jgi:hypothetical protein
MYGFQTVVAVNGVRTIKNKRFPWKRKPLENPFNLNLYGFCLFQSIKISLSSKIQVYCNDNKAQNNRENHIDFTPACS